MEKSNHTQPKIDLCPTSSFMRNIYGRIQRCGEIRGYIGKESLTHREVQEWERYLGPEILLRDLTNFLQI